MSEIAEFPNNSIGYYPDPVDPWHPYGTIVFGIEDEYLPQYCAGSEIVLPVYLPRSATTCVLGGDATYKVAKVDGNLVTLHLIKLVKYLFESGEEKEIPLAPFHERVRASPPKD